MQQLNCLGQSIKWVKNSVPLIRATSWQKKDSSQTCSFLGCLRPHGHSPYHPPELLKHSLPMARSSDFHDVSNTKRICAPNLRLSQYLGSTGSIALCIQFIRQPPQCMISH